MFANKSRWQNGLWYVNINWSVVYFIKHSELRNQSPNVEMIPAQNVHAIICGCCALIVDIWIITLKRMMIGL